MLVRWHFCIEMATKSTHLNHFQLYPNLLPLITAVILEELCWNVEKTLNDLRSIIPMSINHFASQSQTCELFYFFFLHWKRIMKSGVISGWTDEDELQIWGSHSSSTNNHLHYVLLVDDGNVNIFSVCHSRKVTVASWFLVLPIDIADPFQLSRV